MAPSNVVKTKVKPQFDGRVVSNDGNVAVIKYKDGESRTFERSRDTATPEQFLKAFAVGSRVTLDWRPETLYGMNSEGPNHTTKKMTVGDLIRELQAYPPEALALISSDEEGNSYKHLYNVIGRTFGEDEDDADDDRFEDHDLKAGDPYVIIWPHG